MAGRLVTGLWIQIRSKHKYNKYMRPTLNGVNISNSLQTKFPFTLTTIKAHKNWHKYNCLLNISWIFSFPSTENPYFIIIRNIIKGSTISIYLIYKQTPSAIIKWTPLLSVCSRINFLNSKRLSVMVTSPLPSLPLTP